MPRNSKGGSKFPIRTYFQLNNLNTKNSFYLTVNPNTDYRTNDVLSWNIFISGKKQGCLNCTIYKNNTAYIPHVEYSKHCNIRQDLAPGKGTVDMFHALFWFLRQNFTDVNTIILEDYSKIQCTPDAAISLAAYSIAFKQKTWYEERFGAIRIPDHQEYLDIIKRFSSNDVKKEKADKVKGAWSIMEHEAPAMYTQLIDLLDASSTFKDFFRKVYDLHKSDSKKKEQEDRCFFIRPWIYNIVAIITGGDIVSPFKWQIHVGSQPDVDFTSTKLDKEPPYVKLVLEDVSDFGMVGSGPSFPAVEWEDD